jgi:hypothetical protein
MLNRFIFFIFILLVAHTLHAQGYVIKNIKDFGAMGNGHTNDHKAFVNAAMFFNQRGGHGKLLIPKGTYIVGDQDPTALGKKGDVLPFVKCSNLTIEGKGAIIKFRDSLRFGAFVPGTTQPYYTEKAVFTQFSYAVPIGSFITLFDCHDITIKNIQADGNSNAMILGGKFGDHGYQLAHYGIFINNCSNVNLEGIYIHHMGCDGIQISNKTPQGRATPDQNIVMKDSRFEYNGRQGLSWVGGSGLKAINCKFSFTGRGRFSTAPASGLDIEAEIGVVQNGIFYNCEFVDNSACGMVADSGESSDMQFNNCLFWGTSSWSMWTTKPNFNFTDCKFYGSIVQCYNAPDDKSATKFLRCSFEDKPYYSKPAYGKYLVEINFKRRVNFDQCTFTANSCKVWWFDGDPGWKDQEKPLMKNAKIILKMNKFPVGDYISVKNCLREGNSVYEIHYSKNKKYYETGSANVDLGNNILVWKNPN